MKIFSAEQIRAWDQFTIINEPVASHELMWRAADALVQWLRAYELYRPVCFVCGTGNNGGDGLAAARILHLAGWPVSVIICRFSAGSSADFNYYLAEMPEGIRVVTLSAAADFLSPEPEEIIVEALLGSGLNRPPQGEYALLIERLNQLPNEKVAVDLPAGLFADRHTPGPCFRAAHTISFQIPKKAFFFPENAAYTGKWTVLPIGLHPEYEQNTPVSTFFFTAPDASAMRRPRATFSHKGTFGHALLCCGSRGKTGAAVLSARACLRAGAGLLTVRVPAGSLNILQIAVPEAMCLPDTSEHEWTTVPDVGAYSAIGVGCGTGTSPATALALQQLLQQTSRPMVLDADALNILAAHPEYWPLVPENSILTPHPKEFERLFGATAHDFDRHDRHRSMAIRHKVVIVLKGAYTATALPDGRVFFNATGNPGMATAGSGDVLTGIITGLLAQGYSPEEAALLGVYAHGSAGDTATAVQSVESLIAGDLIEHLGWAFRAMIL